MSIETLPAPSTEATPENPALAMSDDEIYERSMQLADELDRMSNIDPTEWPEGSNDYYDTMRKASIELEDLQAPLEKLWHERAEQEKQRRQMGNVGFKLFGRKR